MIVKLEDAAVLGYCRRGCRAFADRYGLDWSRFVFDGIDSGELEQIDDEMVRDLIEQAKRRTEAENG